MHMYEHQAIHVTTSFLVSQSIFSNDHLHILHFLIYFGQKFIKAVDTDSPLQCNFTSSLSSGEKKKNHENLYTLLQQFHGLKVAENFVKYVCHKTQG